MNEFETNGWRDHTPGIHLKGDILSKATQVKSPIRIRLWAVGLAGSGIGAAFLSTVFLAGSAPITVAQVIEAGEKPDSVTVVNRRIMQAGKPGWTHTNRIVGEAWRSDISSAENEWMNGTFNYRDSKRVVAYISQVKVGVIDEPSHRYKIRYRQPKISELLKDFKAAKVEKDFEWNGRKVTRFTYKLGTKVEEELLADPITNLPIKFTQMRDNRQWGDEWTYDYSPLSLKDIEPSFPEGTQILEYTKQREAMKQAVISATGAVPFVEIGTAEVTAYIPVPKGKLRGNMSIEISLSAKDGKTRTFKGTQNASYTQKLLIRGKEFLCVRYSDKDVAWNDKWYGSKTSGYASVNGKKTTFSNVPVILTAASYGLDEPYVIDYRDKHPAKPTDPPHVIRQ